MLKALPVLPVAVLACILLSGCANKEKQVEGKWKVDPAKVPSLGSNPAMAMAQGFVNNATLEFKPDKTYTLTIGVPIAGTWALTDSGSFSLSPQTIMGQPAGNLAKAFQGQASTNPTLAQGMNSLTSPMTATLSDDAKSLSIAGFGGGQQPLVFTKDAA